ncbi:MAG: S8 family serine peptidase [Candidatus Kapabacteria bacterium]|nr:S8 family serine peptidase [Candidatus Kapabacteria bacterium]
MSYCAFRHEDAEGGGERRGAVLKKKFKVGLKFSVELPIYDGNSTWTQCTRSMMDYRAFVKLSNTGAPMSRCITLLVLTLTLASNLVAQNWVSIGTAARNAAVATNQAALRFEEQKHYATLYALQHNLNTEFTLSTGALTSLQAIENGHPVYVFGISTNSAQTVRSNQTWSGGSLGLSLNGSGQVLGVWDEARVRATHREFRTSSNTSRITQGDNPANNSNHATHVSGTMIAQGVTSSARGMSNAATIRAYDWNSDESEMRTAAGQFNVRTSNHSYGYITGWIYNFRGDGRWVWLGVPSVSAIADYRFGFYSSASAAWDNVARDYPNYLICKAAGNDRGEGPNAGTEHWVWQNNTWTLTTATRDRDGGANGYDCIEGAGLAKNVMTVGAVNYVQSYTGPSSVTMSSFSGFGPTDDGRIKPDIVAMGVSEYSTLASNDSAYANYSGTSMATPAVTGSIGLLMQHHANIKQNASPMRSSTVKGLIIHTADEAGSNPGPDYRFGWGLMNTARATQVMSANANRSEDYEIQERTMQQGQTITINGTSAGNEAIRVTICWTDPAGTPASASLNPTNLMLRNDLDVRVQRSGSSTVFAPWVLNPAQPANAATTGDNTRDNVEQVFIAQPQSGQYSITITHKGTLTGSSQLVSVIISGLTPNALVANAGEDKSVCLGSSTTLNGSAAGSNTVSYAWRVSGTTTVLDTTANITVSPSQTTTYQLTVTSGNLTATDEAVVTVNALPIANAGADRTINAGQTTVLACTTNATTNTVVWRNTATNAAVGTTASLTVQPFTTTSYFCTVTNANQCIARDTVVVTVNPVAVTANAGADRVLCNGSSVTFNGNGTGAGTLSYQWRDISTNTVVSTVRALTASPSSTREYELRVTDQATNIARDTMRISVMSTWQPTIVPQSATCRNRQVRYTISSLSGATYQWTCGNGAIVSGAQSNSCVILWNNSGSSAIVGVTVTLGTCTSTKVDTLTLHAQPNPNFTSSNACVGDTKTYTTSSTSGSQYTWSLPQSGGTIASGQGTNSIQVGWTGSGSRQVRLVEVNSAGCSATLTRSLTINAIPTPNISVNNSETPRVGQQRTYSVQSQSGRTYSWSINGGTINSGQNSASCTVTWNNPGNASITVTETITNGGCVGSTTQTIMVSQMMLDNAEVLDIPMSVAPNPATDVITISIGKLEADAPATLTVAALDGIVIHSFGISGGGESISRSLDISELPAGTYFVRLTKGNQTQSIKFIKH